MIWRRGCFRSIPAYAGEPCCRHPANRPSAVYPRVCGGTQGMEIVRIKWRGLSPRMRGNQVIQQQSRHTVGSIPAYAGEPAFCWLTSETSEVYPRVCGGTHLDCAAHLAGQGLSPRMRGNRSVGLPSAVHWWSIPAYAGEPAPSAHRPRSRWVYPRVCGGTPGDFAEQLVENGLSPRMRGNPRLLLPPALFSGSIPAYAGEPLTFPYVCKMGWVYPRVCGGTGRVFEEIIRQSGLSPRMRGNPGTSPASRRAAGSIPAYAGEPCRQGHIRPQAEVYPRVCGGTVCNGWQLLRFEGLSPRMRGNRPTVSYSSGRPGSIPAYAGEPGGWDAWQIVDAVYPRVCGGTDDSVRRLMRKGGLSPRMRGNLPHRNPPSFRPGSIPAYAGEPIAAKHQLK